MAYLLACKLVSQENIGFRIVLAQEDGGQLSKVSQLYVTGYGGSLAIADSRCTNLFPVEVGCGFA